MPSFNFVHAADLHLDTPFDGVGRSSPELRKKLRDATLDAFDDLVRLCIEEEARFLVLAGDVYDGPERGIRAQLRFRRGLQELDEAGIDVFIASGNHDPLSAAGWKAVESWPGRVRFFGERVESFPVVREGQTLARVHGISFPRREVTENLAERFSRHPDPVFQVGVLHATLGAHEGHAPYAPTTMETLAASGLDYWALGHVHTRSTLRAHAPTVTYPGNLQALSPRETGPRGALLVRVDERGDATPEFRALDRVRFARISVDTSDIADLFALQTRLSALAEDARNGSEGRDLLLSALLTGRSRLHGALAQTGALAELLGMLREREEGTDPLLWWSEIDDRTSPQVDFEALRGQDSLPAALFAEAERLTGNPAQLAERARAVWGELDAHASAGRMLTPPDEEETLRILEEARNLIVERLLGEEAP
jgi:DNA repair exonuclease SbcCD nuclease subunit